MKIDWNGDFMLWLRAALARAARTFAQAALASLGATALVTEVDWAVVLSSAALAFLASLLTSLAGLPEVRAEERLKELEGGGGNGN